MRLTHFAGLFRRAGRRRSRSLATPATLAVVLVVAMGAAGCGAFTTDPGAPGWTVVGTVTVTGRPCPVPPETSAISSGTLVRVTDAAGTEVASSPLGPGETAANLEPGGCVFPFSVSGLPREPGLYTVAIGEDSRLTHQITAQQLRNNIPVRFIV